MNVFGSVLLLCWGWSLCQAETRQAERRFTAVFMENSDTASNLYLYLVTQDKEATVNVSVSDPGFHKEVSIGVNSSAIVTLDAQYMISGTQLSSKAVIVTSNVDISAFAFISHEHTADATLLLSEEDLGMEYYIFTPGEKANSQFAVASGIDRVDWVNVTVSGSLKYGGKSYNTGDTIPFLLGPQEVVQFQSNTDLTGSRVSASAPVAVFSGHKCFSSPSTSCDVQFEQLHPVKNWGSFFVVFPLASHTKDVIDIMAAKADTVLKVDETEYRLQPGSHVTLPLEGGITVNSSKPIMVSYLFQDRVGTSIKYDPFLTTVPPVLSSQKYYTFVTNSSVRNYIMVVSQASSASEFYLDQKPLHQYNPTTQEKNGFRSWEVFIGETGGRHDIYHSSSSFIIYVYGLGQFTSYGYSMGQEKRYPMLKVLRDTEPKSPVFTCFSHGAEFSLPLSLVSDAQLTVSDVHLKDPMCKGIQKGEFVVIEVPFSRCRSKALSMAGMTFYINTVYGTVPGTDVHRIEFPLQCVMEANETLGLSLLPQVTDMVSFSRYNVSMRFYQSEAFTDVITTYPYEVDLHSKLYVEIKVESDDKDLQILVEDFKASPSLQEGGNNYSLICNGCLEDSTLQKLPVQDQALQHFSLHVFKFKDLEKVYLSCNVIICHRKTSPNRCSQGCLPRRQRRDIPSSKGHQDSARLSGGPFILSDDGLSRQYSISPGVLAAVVGVLGTLFVVGLVIQKHIYKRRGET